MAPLSAAHRRYFAIEIAIGMVLNAVISAAFAWGIFRGVAHVPLWAGTRGMAFDLVPTVFMITLMMTIALTLITRARLRRGAAPALAWSRDSHVLLRLLPRNAVGRGLCLAAGATIVLVPLSVACLAGAGFQTMAFGPFVWFKVAYGVALAVLVTPIILLCAFGDLPAASAAR